MTKGELRKLRKQARASGVAYTVEVGENGPEAVRSRTRREEAKHQDRMSRVAQAVYEYDRDF